MAHDEALAAALRDHFAPLDASERAMFGGVGFMVEGHMVAAASGKGGLMIRCQPDRTTELIAAGGAEPVVMRDQEILGWVRVRAEDLPDEASLAAWLEPALAFVASLPPKR